VSQGKAKKILQNSNREGSRNTDAQSSNKLLRKIEEKSKRVNRAREKKKHGQFGFGLTRDEAALRPHGINALNRRVRKEKSSKKESVSAYFWAVQRKKKKYNDLPLPSRRARAEGGGPEKVADVGSRIDSTHGKGVGSCQNKMIKKQRVPCS